MNGDRVRHEITAGNASGTFALNPDTGELTGTGNPAAATRRSYTLAVRAADAATRADNLNWSAATAITSWDGITVTGAGDRNQPGLAGFILPEPGHRLRLTGLRLLGTNALTGCTPDPQREVSDNDLAASGLPAGTPRRGFKQRQTGIIPNTEPVRGLLAAEICVWNRRILDTALCRQALPETHPAQDTQLPRLGIS